MHVTGTKRVSFTPCKVTLHSSHSTCLPLTIVAKQSCKGKLAAFKGKLPGVPKICTNFCWKDFGIELKTAESAPERADASPLLTAKATATERSCRHQANKISPTASVRGTECLLMIRGKKI